MNLVFADGKLIQAESWIKSAIPESPRGYVELPKTFQPDQIVLAVITQDFIGKFVWSGAVHAPPLPVDKDGKLVKYTLRYEP